MFENELLEYDRIFENAEKISHMITPEKPFTIAFFGRFKTGKSSLINALLGNELLPTKATTATAVVTRIRNGQRMRAFVLRGQRSGVDYKPDGKNLQEVTIEEARNVILYDQTKDYSNTPEVLFELPVDWLPPKVELLDTPGLNDGAADGMLEKITLQAIAGADMCIGVYDASSFISEGERSITREVQRLLGGNLVFAVNRTNCLNSMEGFANVESLAESEFKPHGNAKVGKGRHFMMCSAPGMTDLDGFDTWLKGMLNSSTAASTRCTLRAVAARSKHSDAVDEAVQSAQKLLDKVRSQIKKTQLEHEARINAEMQRKKSEQNELLQSLKMFSVDAAARFSQTDELENQLAGLMQASGWEINYAVFSKLKVKSYYSGLFDTLAQEFKKQFKRTPCISAYASENAIDALNFPGAQVEGGSSGWGWGTVAATFTFLVTANPVIAGAAGMAAKKASSRGGVNRSVPNTIDFVKSNVTTYAAGRFDAQLNADIEQMKEEWKKIKYKSGLEDTLKNLGTAESGIEARIQRGRQLQTSLSINTSA